MVLDRLNMQNIVFEETSVTAGAYEKAILCSKQQQTHTKACGFKLSSKGKTAKAMTYRIIIRKINV